jgi:hypothetical protein
VGAWSFLSVFEKAVSKIERIHEAEAGNSGRPQSQ